MHDMYTEICIRWTICHNIPIAYWAYSHIFFVIFAYCPAYYFAYFAYFFSYYVYCFAYFFEYSAYWGKLVRASFCSTTPKAWYGVSWNFRVFSQTTGGRVSAGTAQLLTINTGPAAAAPQQFLPDMKPSLHQSLRSWPALIFILGIRRGFWAPATTKISRWWLRKRRKRAGPSLVRDALQWVHWSYHTLPGTQQIEFCCVVVVQ